MRLLLLFLFLLSAASALTPLVCTTRADAVAVIAAGCTVTVDCTFEFGNGSLSLPQWDVLLTTQTGLLSDDATTPADNDIRFLFDLPNYVTLPLIAYDNTSMDAVDCAPIAAAPQSCLPDAVFGVLANLGRYQRYLSDDAPCPDLNQAGVWTNATGIPKIVCQCLPGKVCSAGNETSEAVLLATVIVIAVMAGILFLSGIITNACLFRKHGRRRREKSLLQHAL